MYILVEISQKVSAGVYRRWVIAAAGLINGRLLVAEMGRVLYRRAVGNAMSRVSSVSSRCGSSSVFVEPVCSGAVEQLVCYRARGFSCVRGC